MANAVSARLQGDDYQARYFWIEACRLFMADSSVSRVGYIADPRAFDGIHYFDSRDWFRPGAPSAWRSFAPNGWHGIATGAAIVFFAYIGFDAVWITEKLMPGGDQVPRYLL